MLQLKLSKVSLSSDGTILTVQDSTGDYNVSTNPGGYGTPNPARPSNVLLRWKMYRDCNWQLISGTYTQSDVESGLAITTVMAGLSSAPGIFPDGVNEIQYLAGYALSGSVNTIYGEDTVEINGLDITTLLPGMYLSFDSDPNTLYKVLSVGGGIITLDTPYGGQNNTETCSEWYSTILDVLLQVLGQNRIDDRLARIPASQIWDEQLNQLCLMTMDELAASAKMDAGDIAGANDLAIAVYNQCLKQPINWA
jgi:hypothetical protein